MSGPMAFLPEMAENQAVEAIFIETIKINWCANEMLDQRESAGFGIENAGFIAGCSLGETGIAAMVMLRGVAGPCAVPRDLSAFAACLFPASAQPCPVRHGA